MIRWGYLSLGISVAVIILLIVFYRWIYVRNRSGGTPELVTRSRLTCSKCHETFDFDYLPGASVTALRFGTSRYMACPLCHKRSLFDLHSTRIPAGPPHGP